MSRVQQAPDAEQQRATKTSASAPSSSVRHAPPVAERPRGTTIQRRQGDALFMLGVLLLGLITVVTLQQFGAAPKGISTTPASSHSASVSPTTSASHAPTVRQANARTYNLPDQQPGLMEPSMDAQGNLWFGEMADNALARFNTRTGVVTSWKAPHGEYNIMETTEDAQGRVWFTEQAANYIGRFDPASQSFTIYPLSQVDGKNAAPQAVQFDASGMLWFTESVAGRIGRLDPATGAIRTWPLPTGGANASGYPYALAVTSTGQVWYGDLSGGIVGRLDPVTGHVTTYHLADNAEIFSMTADAHGHIWFTELNSGVLGEINTATGVIAEHVAPSGLGAIANAYGVLALPDGSIWFASGGQNGLVRYTPASNTFAVFRLAQPSSAPYGLALGSDGRIWLTTDGQPANYLAVVTPQ